MQAPPYLVSFKNTDDFFHSLSKDTLDSYGNDIKLLVEKKYPPIVSIRVLAVLFGYSPKLVGSLLSRTDKYYRVFNIKTGGKTRRIEAPKVGLKVIQKWIAEHLANAVEFDDCVHGFIKGRSYISAAKEHLNSEWVYSIDIKDFFQTTPMQKIHRTFVELGYPEHGAKIISKLCCYNGCLAQGSPASPLLSNLVFLTIDNQIKQQANDLNITYTRYADDLVFSGRGDFPEQIKNVKSLIEEHGWIISRQKEHFSSLPNRLKVHGLLVHGDKVRLTKGYRNKLRAFRHMLNNDKISRADRARVKGHINLADHIDKISNE